MILLVFTSIYSLFPPQTPPITHFLAIFMTECIYPLYKGMAICGELAPLGLLHTNERIKNELLVQHSSQMQDLHTH